MEEKVYDFCSKCGALTLNGVCSACGNKGRVKRMRHSEENVVSHSHTTSDDIWQKQDKSKEPAKRQGKSSGKRIKAFLIFIMLFILGGCGRIIYSYVGVTKSANAVFDQFWEEQDEDITDFENDEVPDEDPDGETTIGDKDDSIFDSTHENHFGETFDGEYYTRFVDCIDESAGYDVEREEYVYKDVVNSTDVIVSYVQIENDKNGRDMSDINEFLKEVGL